MAEVSTGALLTAAVATVWSPGDPWLLDEGFHPAWVPVFALAARYGPPGVYVSLAAECAVLAALAVVTGVGIDGLYDRAGRTSDLLVVFSALLVGWSTMAHRRRLTRAAEREAEATEQRAEATEALEAMSSSLAYLRDRCDRIDVSITVWRELANRIEHGSRQAAARAVLELCAMRFGADAGAVEVFATSGRKVLAWRGRWSADALRPGDLSRDRTVRAALAVGCPTTAASVPGTTAADCCVAVPLRDHEDGTEVGVIALRVRDPAMFREAELHELMVVAEWLSPRLVGLTREPRLRAVSEGVVR